MMKEELLPHTNLVLFDGVCNLCNGFVQFLIKYDRHERMTFGPLQSETARTILDKLDSAKRPGKTTNHVESVVYIRQSTLYSESTAVLWILRDLGGAWRVFILLRIAPRFLRDAIYRWIAKNRYRWMGKQDKCMVPTPELRSRFIE